MATKKKTPTQFLTDSGFWAKTHQAGQPARLGSWSHNVPIARITHNGDREEAEGLARRAAADISEIRAVDVTNVSIRLMVNNSGVMSKERADEIRNAFLAKIRQLAAEAAAPKGNGKTQRRSGNQPAHRRGRTHARA